MKRFDLYAKVGECYECGREHDRGSPIGTFVSVDAAIEAVRGGLDLKDGRYDGTELIDSESGIEVPFLWKDPEPPPRRTGFLSEKHYPDFLDGISVENRVAFISKVNETVWYSTGISSEGSPFEAAKDFTPLEAAYTEVAPSLGIELPSPLFTVEKGPPKKYVEVFTRILHYEMLDTRDEKDLAAEWRARHGGDWWDENAMPWTEVGS